jgi:hypothetical protein
MMCERSMRDTLRARPLVMLGGAPVQLPALGMEQPCVDDVVDEGVAEDPSAVTLRAVAGDEVEPLEHGEPIVDAVAGEVAQRGGAEGQPEHAAHLQDRLHASRQTVDAASDHRFDSVGRLDAQQLGERAARSPASRIDEQAAVAQRVDELARPEERVAARLGLDQRRDGGRQPLPGGVGGQLERLRGRQRPDAQVLAARDGDETHELARGLFGERSRREHEQQRSRRERKPQGKRERGRVEPVSVLEHDKPRCAVGERRERLREQVAGRLGARLASQARRRRAVRKRHLQHRGQQPGQLGDRGRPATVRRPHAGEPVEHLIALLARVLRQRLQAERLLEHAAPAVVQRSALDRIAGTGMHRDALRRGVLDEVADEPRLADPGLALEHDDPTAAGAQRPHETFAARALLDAVDERGRGGRRAGVARRSEQLAHRHRDAAPLDLERRERTQLVALLDALREQLLDEDLPFAGAVHEPGGEVRRAALQSERTTRGPAIRAGVEAAAGDPDPSRPEAAGALRRGAQHERRGRGAQRVVVVGDRRAESGTDVAALRMTATLNSVPPRPSIVSCAKRA